MRLPVAAGQLVWQPFPEPGVLGLEGPHVLAALDSEDVRLRSGGQCSLDGEWFVELRYLFR